MTTKRRAPGQHTVAWWLRTLKIQGRGCIRAVPDPADPLAVAAYNEALRQLAAAANREARAEPEATP